MLSSLQLMREVVGDVVEERKHGSSGLLQRLSNVSRSLYIVFEIAVVRLFITDKLSAFAMPDSSARKRSMGKMYWCSNLRSNPSLETPHGPMFFHAGRDWVAEL